MTNFKYKPIDGACRILQPLKGGDNPIQCRLFEWKLASPEYSCDYSTLSYTWGSRFWLCMSRRNGIHRVKIDGTNPFSKMLTVVVVQSKTWPLYCRWDGSLIAELTGGFSMFGADFSHTPNWQANIIKELWLGNVPCFYHTNFGYSRN